MSFVLPDEPPLLGIPIHRLPHIIDDLGGAPKAGTVCCGQFFAKSIRPVCKGNGLPLATQIALKDESTRSSKARCAPADVLVIQGSGHGFMHTCAALMLHMNRDLEPSHAGADGTRDVQVCASARMMLSLPSLKAEGPDI